MPLISVYTPTHAAGFLSQAWESLRQQQGEPNYEWIIVPNGDCGSLPAELLADRHVRVFPATHLTGRIGALKQFALQHAQGDLFVELDHDDVLAPTALQKLAKAADVSKPQFLFSDFAAFEGEFKPYKYDVSYGWETYPVHLSGRELLAFRAFEACPVSLGHLQFSPNHVRAWTRPAYASAGGYSDKFDIADDYDLMLRTWLAGVEFLHIPECLYLYRVDDHSTSGKFGQNAKIQELQHELSLKHSDAVLEEWCRRKKLSACELSISTNTAGKLPVLSPLTNVERKDGRLHFTELSDLPDNSHGQIDINHLLPYLPSQLIVPFFDECYRVLAPGGWLRCRVPSTEGKAAFTNPLYRSYWNETTFWTFTKKQFAELAGNRNSRFYTARSWTALPKWEHTDETYPLACVDLVALKGQKQPGRLGI